MELRPVVGRHRLEPPGVLAHEAHRPPAQGVCPPVGELADEHQPGLAFDEGDDTVARPEPITVSTSQWPTRPAPRPLAAAPRSRACRRAGRGCHKRRSAYASSYAPRAGGCRAARPATYPARHPSRPYSTEDDRDPGGALSALDAFHVREVDAEHLPVEEQERGGGLVLRRSRDVPLGSQVGELAADLIGAYPGGAALAVEEDKAADV